MQSLKSIGQFSTYLGRASDIAAVGTIFDVFSYDAVTDGRKFHP